MKKSIKLKNFIAAGALALATAFGAVAASSPAYARCQCVGPSDNQTCTDTDTGDSCTPATTGGGATGNGGVQDGINQTASNFGNQTLEGSVTNIINIVLYIVGILAVVMMIIGGIQYTTSGGDQAAVTKAKNTILYGIVGLVIAILAYAIVNFVITRI